MTRADASSRLAALPERHDVGRLTLDDLRDLAPTLSTEQVAALLGCSPWTLYEAVRGGRAPVEPIRVGRVLRWPTLLILQRLGVDPAEVL